MSSKVILRLRGLAMAIAVSALAACGGGDDSTQAGKAAAERALGVEGDATWTQCAQEHGTCNFSGTRQVRYGLDGRYAYKVATGSIGCNND